MAEIHCPYCYGKNLSKIVYAKKGINKRKKQDYKLLDNEIIMPKNRLKKSILTTKKSQTINYIISIVTTVKRPLIRHRIWLQWILKGLI